MKKKNIFTLFLLMAAVGTTSGALAMTADAGNINTQSVVSDYVAATKQPINPPSTERTSVKASSSGGSNYPDCLRYNFKYVNAHPVYTCAERATQENRTCRNWFAGESFCKGE